VIRLALIVLVCGAVPLAGCERRRADQPAPAAAGGRAAASAGEVTAGEGPVEPGASPGEPSCAIEPRPLRRAAPARLIAIGDVHGDLAATRAALRLAGAIDQDDRWIGGPLGVVQLGDLLDRGDDEQAIIDLFEVLERQAAAAGGSFTWLLGNHELMNAAGDFRYVTAGGWRDFEDAPGVDPTRADSPEIAAALAAAPPETRHRAAAFLPGGAYARVLAGQDVVAIIGESVFAHAGPVPAWSAELESMNRAARCWLEGAGPAPAALTDEDGPVWTRAWGADPVDCARLGEVLTALGVSRMVVAHTPQPGGITSACDGRLWRIDTGMAAAYGGPVQVLEIIGDEVRPVLEGRP
jgi:hypothetical protein